MRKNALKNLSWGDFVRIKDRRGFGANRIARVVEYPVEGNPGLVTIEIDKFTHTLRTDEVTTDGVEGRVYKRS